jgi:hypothetical protein
VVLASGGAKTCDKIRQQLIAEIKPLLGGAVERINTATGRERDRYVCRALPLVTREDLLDVEFVLTNIASHPWRHQISQGQPLEAALAHFSGRDMIEAWWQCTAVDALPIGDKQWIIWEVKGPIAIAHNQLKSSKHLVQGCCRIVILPGEDTLGSVTPSQKKDVCVGRIYSQQALVHVKKQTVGTESDRGIRQFLHRQLHHLQTLFQGRPKNGLMWRDFWQQKEDFMETKRSNNGVSNRQVRVRNRIVGPTQYS